MLRRGFPDSPQGRNGPSWSSCALVVPMSPKSRRRRLLPYTEPEGGRHEVDDCCRWTDPGGRASASAQRLDVKIIDRQDKEDAYDYAAVYNNVAVENPSRFTVRRSHFSFLMPTSDCQLRKQICGAHGCSVGNRRSCRTPLVDSIQAAFNGDNAKLIWPVSLDGKKMQSETYKI